VLHVSAQKWIDLAIVASQAMPLYRLCRQSALAPRDVRSWVISHWKQLSIIGCFRCLKSGQETVSGRRNIFKNVTDATAVISDTIAYPCAIGRKYFCVEKQKGEEKPKLAQDYN